MMRPYMTRCDIVIPTYNNASVLPVTTAALIQQHLPSGWSARLIFSDDGSTDGTLHFLQELTVPPAWEYAVVTGIHTGPAGARNRALRHVQGQVILLLNADIILQPGALAAHLEFHQRHLEESVGGLGFITWDPRLALSPLMEWMMHGGPQNNYDALLGVHTADPRQFFSAAHLSLKTALLARYHFNEAFTAYGWEDTELGRRLADAGLILHVLHDAHSLHRHTYSVAAVCQRQFAVGQSLVTYQELHPDVALLPSRSWWQYGRDRVLIALGLPWVLGWLTKIIGSRLTLPLLYSRLTSVYFWWGVYVGKAKKRQETTIRPKKG